MQLCNAIWNPPKQVLTAGGQILDRGKKEKFVFYMTRLDSNYIIHVLFHKVTANGSRKSANIRVIKVTQLERREHYPVGQSSGLWI